MARSSTSRSCRGARAPLLSLRPTHKRSLPQRTSATRWRSRWVCGGIAPGFRTRALRQRLCVGPAGCEAALELGVATQGCQRRGAVAGCGGCAARRQAHHAIRWWRRWWWRCCCWCWWRRWRWRRRRRCCCCCCSRGACRGVPRPVPWPAAAPWFHARGDLWLWRHGPPSHRGPWTTRAPVLPVHEPASHGRARAAVLDDDSFREIYLLCFVFTHPRTQRHDAPALFKRDSRSLRASLLTFSSSVSLTSSTPCTSGM